MRSCCWHEKKHERKEEGGAKRASAASAKGSYHVLCTPKNISKLYKYFISARTPKHACSAKCKLCSAAAEHADMRMYICRQQHHMVQKRTQEITRSPIHHD
jgi:hypothetical protein